MTQSTYKSDLIHNGAALQKAVAGKKRFKFVPLHSQLSKDLRYKTLLDEIEKHLGSAIVYTGRMISNEINNHFTSTGANITFEQMGVLFFIVLHKGKEIIQQDLAAIMNKNKSAILRTIDLLEKKGYVKRVAVSGDRRKNIIQATATGSKIVKQALLLSNKLEREYTKKISQKDMDTCMKVLKQIQTEFKNSKDPSCNGNI